MCSGGIGVTIVQRVRTVGGFINIGNAVLVAVTVRIVSVGIVNVGHTVAIVVGIVIVDQAVVVEITHTNRCVRNTGIVVVGVVSRVQWV